MKVQQIIHLQQISCATDSCANVKQIIHMQRGRDLECHMLLCRPFWLPREFTAIIIMAVYIPPQANTDQALRELYGNISEQETAHLDAAFIIMGDFNKANFRTIAPKYFQHITINTRGDCVLDHCYTHFRDEYKSSPAHLSANRITLPFCSCLLIGRN